MPTKTVGTYAPPAAPKAGRMPALQGIFKAPKDLQFQSEAN
jgi:hypothetical protein